MKSRTTKNNINTLEARIITQVIGVCIGLPLIGLIAPVIYRLFN